MAGLKRSKLKQRCNTTQKDGGKTSLPVAEEIRMGEIKEVDKGKLKLLCVILIKYIYSTTNIFIPLCADKSACVFDLEME